MKIALIGGDGRMARVSCLLKERGMSVHTLALSPSPSEMHIPPSRLCEMSAIVLPLPATRDGTHPCAGKEEGPPSFDDIFATAKEVPFFGGAVPPVLFDRAKAAGVRLIDYYLDEELLEKNAYATAEAAVAMAIADLPIVLRGARVGVVGSGRIARALCLLLTALGAHVTLYARNPVALASLAGRGACPHLLTKERPLVLDEGLRAVFSTVPAPILDAAALAKLKRGTPIYDLGGGAVAGGVCHERGLTLPDCRALPGRYSPESAASDLCDALLRAFLREGVTVL